MFKQLFDAMNEMLDEIIMIYPTAKEHEKTKINDDLHALKAISDTYIEEWLLFEEKMGKVSMMPQPAIHSHVKQEDEAYVKGQGYYKLSMHEQALEQFEAVVKQQSNYGMVQLYMAICYYEIGQLDRAYEHFQSIISQYESDPSASFYSHS